MEFPKIKKNHKFVGNILLFWNTICLISSVDGHKSSKKWKWSMWRCFFGNPWNDESSTSEKKKQQKIVVSSSKIIRWGFYSSSSLKLQRFESFTHLLHLLCQVVDKISLLGTIKTANTDHMQRIMFATVKRTDLSFNKKQRLQFWGTGLKTACRD